MIDKNQEWKHTQKVLVMMIWYGLGGTVMFLDIIYKINGLYLWTGLIYFVGLLAIAHYIK